MTKLLLGVIGDNTMAFWEASRLISKSPVWPSYGLLDATKALELTEPLLWKSFLTLSQIGGLGPISTWNLFVLTFTLLNMAFSYKFFRLYVQKNISYALSLVWSFSPYFFSHYQDHISLFAGFLYPMYFAKLLGPSSQADPDSAHNMHTGVKSNKHFLTLGVLTGLSLLTSNYIGFFIFILTCFFIFQVYNGTPLALISRGIAYCIPVVATVFIFIYPFLVSSGTFASSVIASRTIEDFFYFSSRPWYFVLPPHDSILYKDFSHRALSFLENDWGHWLAQNYFKGEHSASFLGYLNVFLASTGFFHVVKKRIKKDLILVPLLVIIFLLMMPPFIPLFGIKVYFPSFLLAKYLPAFRVLARLSIVFLLFFLVFVGRGIEFFIKRFTLGTTSEIPLDAMPNVTSEATSDVTSETISDTRADKNTVRCKVFLVVAVYVIVALAEFIMPLKFTSTRPVPAAYKLMGQKFVGENFRFVVFPYSQSSNFMYWTYIHKQHLLNKRATFDNASSIDSAKFTSLLTTCKGLRQAQDYGVTHIAYYKRYDATNTFFETSPNLVLEETFTQKQAPKQLQKTKFYDINIDAVYPGDVQIYRLVDSVSCT